MKNKPVILIVDDEKNSREGLARALRRQHEVLLAEGGTSALDILQSRHVDILLSDVRMPGMDGLTLLQRTLALPHPPVCIMLTAYGSVELAVEAMKRGAYDFLTKPIHLDRLDILLKRALHTRDIEQENRQLHEQLDSKYGLGNIIGSSPAMQEVFDTIKLVAASRASVLIQGESGTGKELVAHAIHRLSPRARGPFVAVHCAALSPTLLESELFGHEKGAYTGATERRRGRFELADGGTLLLDEIGEIDLNTQVKILRVLEQRTFERVGGQETIETDTRLIAATNRDLKAMVQNHTFREDLFFRLYVVVITIPPLRDRREDIPHLVQHFLKQSADENNRSIEGLSPDAMNLLLDYPWPGNVRELRNAIERMVVLSRNDRLTLRDVPSDLRAQTIPLSGTPAPEKNPLSLAHAERSMIVKALKANQGNRTLAARQLGISRRTLHRKLLELKEDNPQDIPPGRPGRTPGRTPS
ncbi:MAG TPA: sigma-54 dependent transcriptional regulator [Kiritimatiellia bacterium]|nr:sigma-54 dependent transcriptional regulator [Kiritimatiellia bacterium]